MKRLNANGQKEGRRAKGIVGAVKRYKDAWSEAGGGETWKATMRGRLYRKFSDENGTVLRRGYDTTV